MIKFKSGDIYLVREPFYTFNVEYRLYKIKKVSLENTIEVEKILITDYHTNYRDCVYLCNWINATINITVLLSRIKEKVPKIIWYKIIRRHIIKQKTNTYSREQFKNW